ncbi:MAG TPA: 8-amino-7-oxononanoate synthase [Candidatus Acidoferrum sp.]|nr:8-amino-7-oxononanoate synthase [Candidatus Acidoferrum sp.]
MISGCVRWNPMPDESDARPAGNGRSASNASPSADLTHALKVELAELTLRGELRTLEIPTGTNLCSNDYLGLSTHPDLCQAIAEAVVRAERFSGTGSRLLAGHAREWEELENEFAAFVGSEAALFFTSGYLANVGLLASVVGRGDLVFSDEFNHASLIDGIRLSSAEKVIYAHRNLKALEYELAAHSARRCRKLIVTESVFSMEGDIAPLAEMSALAQRHGAALIVDEAHAIGVFGPSGRGCVADAHLEKEVFATIHTCGKALASAGAFVCGTPALKAFLINRARTFLFNSALPPYFAAQIRAALSLARAADAERTRLQSMARNLRARLRESGWDTLASQSQIVPVMVGDNAAASRIAAELAEKGFAIRAIRPPTVPEGTARLRISLTCNLTNEDLERLCVAMNESRVRGAAAGAR